MLTRPSTSPHHEHFPHSPPFPSPSPSPPAFEIELGQLIRPIPHPPSSLQYPFTLALPAVHLRPPPSPRLRILTNVWPWWSHLGTKGQARARMTRSVDRLAASADARLGAFRREGKYVVGRRRATACQTRTHASTNCEVSVPEVAGVLGINVPDDTVADTPHAAATNASASSEDPQQPIVDASPALSGPTREDPTPANVHEPRTQAVATEPSAAEIIAHPGIEETTAQDASFERPIGDTVPVPIPAPALAPEKQPATLSAENVSVVEEALPAQEIADPLSTAIADARPDAPVDGTDTETPSLEQVTYDAQADTPLVKDTDALPAEEHAPATDPPAADSPVPEEEDLISHHAALGLTDDISLVPVDAAEALTVPDLEPKDITADTPEADASTSANSGAPLTVDAEPVEAETVETPAQDNDKVVAEPTQPPVPPQPAEPEFNLSEQPAPTIITPVPAAADVDTEPAEPPAALVVGADVAKPSPPAEGEGEAAPVVEDRVALAETQVVEEPAVAAAAESLAPVVVVGNEVVPAESESAAVPDPDASTTTTDQTNEAAPAQGEIAEAHVPETLAPSAFASTEEKVAEAPVEPDSPAAPVPLVEDGIHKPPSAKEEDVTTDVPVRAPEMVEQEVAAAPVEFDDIAAAAAGAGDGAVAEAVDPTTEEAPIKEIKVIDSGVTPDADSAEPPAQVNASVAEEGKPVADAAERHTSPLTTVSESEPEANHSQDSAPIALEPASTAEEKETSAEAEAEGISFESATIVDPYHLSIC
ncbi:hypothetical protein D9619_009348 [Psilocybe cf. subviscida]|uniref:Uncharacterized protein n=1 Tax=Psilocybe cf. subviscida TaxID=2480587 RepID=A0A8H5FAS8_9AGAR|nr:hypothetical protein D9619_009348 [Psilocybe cf. subviscida]